MADTGLNLPDSVFEKLLKERIIFLGSEVNDDVANRLCAQMLLLAAEDPHTDISMYINSPGGSVTAGMAIYDTMQFISCDVATYAMGMAASMGQFLLVAARHHVVNDLFEDCATTHMILNQLCRSVTLTETRNVYLLRDSLISLVEFFLEFIKRNLNNQLHTSGAELLNSAFHGIVLLVWGSR